MWYRAAAEDVVCEVSGTEYVTVVGSCVVFGVLRN